MPNAARLLVFALLVGLLQADRATGQDRIAATPLMIGETFSIDSKVLKEKRRINVYLPSAYGDPKLARLPVLYMPDGGMAEDFLHIAGIVQVSSGNGTMRPHILVGIENTERRRDLTGPTDVKSDREIAPNAGGSAAFRKFLRDELKPEINARYRTTRESAIVGESLAGFFVVETLLLEPDLFDTYIAIDPSLWWNNQQLAKSAVETTKSRAGNKKSLFLATSEEKEMAEIVKNMAAALREHRSLQIFVHYEAMPEEKHSTIFHPAALKGLRRMLSDTSTK
jgi:uncharacterized protein